MIEGFEATTKPLPEIMARQLTDNEKKLMGDIAKSGVKVGNAYTNAVNERLGFFDDLFSAELGAGAKAFEGIGVTEGAKKREQEKLDKEKGKGGSKLAAAESRFLTRGSGELAPEQQMVEEQKETKDLIGKVADGMSQAVGFLQTISTQDLGDAIEVIQSNKGG